MLSERQLEELLRIFQQRTQAVTEEYLKRMGEHLKQIGQLTPTDVNRLVQMKRVNANIEVIKREIARAAGVMIEDVETVFRDIAASDERFAREIFAENHTPTVKYSPTAEISSPVERILKAQLRITQQEMANLSQTTIDDALYRMAVDKAVQLAQTGMTDYSTAIRKALKEAAANGLKVIYPSGYSRRLDTAVRQNVLDGIRSMQQDILDQIGKEYRADGVEISAHSLCAADHLPYQGLQYRKKDFERIQNTLERPFGMWNCKHFMFPIIVGITEPTYTKEELELFARNSNEEITIDDRTLSRYEWTQQQRRIETAIRAQKDIAVAAAAAGDMPARREAQRNINALQETYAKISKAAGLYEMPERMRVSGFRKVKTVDELKKKTEYDTMRTYSDMLKTRKVIRKSNEIRNLPMRGDPDSISDLLVEDGSMVLTRRVYDYRGIAFVDFDTTDHAKPKYHPTYAHKHVLDHSKKNPHTGAEPLTDYDLANNTDIIQKGVNYFDQK